MEKILLTYNYFLLVKYGIVYLWMYIFICICFILAIYMCICVYVHKGICFHTGIKINLSRGEKAHAIDGLTNKHCSFQQYKVHVITLLYYILFKALVLFTPSGLHCILKKERNILLCSKVNVYILLYFTLFLQLYFILTLQ